MSSMLFKARFKYSSFLRRPTFSAKEKIKDQLLPHVHATARLGPHRFLAKMLCMRHDDAATLYSVTWPNVPALNLVDSSRVLIEHEFTLCVWHSRDIVALTCLGRSQIGTHTPQLRTSVGIVVPRHVFPIYRYWILIYFLLWLVSRNMRFEPCMLAVNSAQVTSNSLDLRCKQLS